MAQQRLTVEMLTNVAKPVLHLNQYEYGDTVEFELYSGGTTFNVPSGSTFNFNGRKPDGRAYSYNTGISFSGNVVTLKIEEQMTAVGGQHEAELVIFTGNVRRSTINIIMDVEDAPFDDDSLISETELPAIIDAARSNAAAAARSADEAANSANTASVKASEAASSATRAQTYAANALASKNAASSSETNAKNYLDQTKSYAVGTNGSVRAGDATDNAEYYYRQSLLNSESARINADKAQAYADFVVPSFVLNTSDMTLSQDDMSTSDFLFTLSNGILSYSYVKP